jgi:hypothetical protein
MGPPIDDVANEFAALLSVLAREPIVPLGTRRIDGNPIRLDEIRQQVPRLRPANGAPAAGISSTELRLILVGLANASEENSNSVIAASRLYHAALSLSAYDVSTAYFSLVAAIECLAGHHFSGKVFSFGEVEKFKEADRLMALILPFLTATNIIDQIKISLLKGEHFVWQKFRRFVEEFLPDEFWTRDEIHQSYIMPDIRREKLNRFLRKAYDARSAFAHAGTPFPAYVEGGTADRVRIAAALEGLALLSAKDFVPVFPWFERLTHSVIIEYVRRVIAPELAARRSELVEEKSGLLAAIESLPEPARQSLGQLTRWTAQFVNFAVIGPKAPNKSWASEEGVTELLKASGLIACEDITMNGSSSLLDRAVGEAAGEFFFGADENPLRGCTILEPRRRQL